MERATSKVTLPVSKSVVTFNDRLTFGEAEDVMSSAAAGAKIVAGSADIDASKAIREQRARKVQVSVVSVVDAHGKEAKFTREWLDALDFEDGNALLAAIEKAHAPKA